MIGFHIMFQYPSLQQYNFPNFPPAVPLSATMANISVSFSPLSLSTLPLPLFWDGLMVCNADNERLSGTSLYCALHPTNTLVASFQPLTCPPSPYLTLDVNSILYILYTLYPTNKNNHAY